jgi:hypothetical protein
MAWFELQPPDGDIVGHGCEVDMLEQLWQHEQNISDQMIDAGIASSAEVFGEAPFSELSLAAAGTSRVLTDTN